MPTLSYCKSVNNCSPNLLHFKVARNERNFILALFFLALRFGPCPAHLLIHIAQCPSCPALLFAHALLCFCLCPLLICPPALPCPAMSSPALSSTALSSPALPANCPISGRSDRKVLRLIYIYTHIYIRMYSGIDAFAVNCVLYLIVCFSR